MILPRSAIVAKYRALAHDRLAADHPARAWVGRLPPYLCRSLILGTGTGPIRSLSAAYVGTRTGTFASAGGLRMSVGGFSERLFARLPLDGHVPLDVPGLAEWLREAMDALRAVDPDAATFTQAWCSLVVWVAPDAARPPKAVLTSVAVPTLPHCTFLSVKSLRHIPARHVHEGASLYALAENLYHEALHQQLSASLVFADHEASPIALNRTRVTIPWRDGAAWRLDRVVHAAWVYAHLQRLRLRALSSGSVVTDERRLVEQAAAESAPKLDYLLAELRRSPTLAEPLRTTFGELASRN